MPFNVSQLDEYGVWLVAVVGGLTALGWIVKKIRGWFTQLSSILVRVDRVVDLAEHELRPNSGSSLYDKIARIEGGVDALWGALDGLGEQFESHLATQAEANRSMWPAVEAIANAQPRED